MKKDPSFSAVWKDPSVWKIMDAGWKWTYQQMGGSGSEASRENFGKKMTFFFEKNEQKCCVFRWVSSQKSFLHSQKENFSWTKKFCSNEIHQMSFEKSVTNLLILLQDSLFSPCTIAKKFINCTKNIGKFTNYKDVKIMKFKSREADVCYSSHFLLTIRANRRIWSLPSPFWNH